MGVTDLSSHVFRLAGRNIRAVRNDILCRKLLREKYAWDMDCCVCVGDNERDIIAGQRAGCGKNFLFHHNFDEIIRNL